MGTIDFENNCTLYICTDNCEVPSVNEIQKKLESQNVDNKIEGMENLIFNIIQGESYGNLLMFVIRFIVPHKDHRLKKMCHIFFEVVDKCNNDGTLKEEMILVCNALRNDLISPNEYVRGSTLRLLSKIKYLKILDPLIEAITKNLNHSHSYVRKNAISCIHTIIKNHGIDVIPNAVKEVEKILFLETDISTKRSALSMLIDIDPLTTLKYVLSLNDQLYDTADVMLLEVIQLFKKLFIPHIFDDSCLEINGNKHMSEDECSQYGEKYENCYENIDDEDELRNSKNDLYGYLQNSNDNSVLDFKSEEIRFKNKKLHQNDYMPYKNNVINILLNMLNKNVSNSVLYEGSCCLLYISNSTLSIKTASECFIKLLINQHDNNIKLIVIDKLYYIMCKWKHILSNYIMDLLRSLNFPSKDVKLKILNLVLHILTKRNVHLVLNVIKKELLKLNEQPIYNSKGLIARGNAQNNDPNRIISITKDEENNGALTKMSNLGDSNNAYSSSIQTYNNNISTNSIDSANYKKILIKSLQHICNMYTTDCLGIVDLLFLYANTQEKNISYESAICIKKLANNSILQNNILEKIIENMFEIKETTILRMFLWTLGQYMNKNEIILNFINILYEQMSYFLNNSMNESDIVSKIFSEKLKKNKFLNFNETSSNIGNNNTTPYFQNIQTKTVILEDGTYATEAFANTQNKSSMNLSGSNKNGGKFSSKNNSNLNQFLYNLFGENDDLLLSVLCVCITKLYLRLLSNVDDVFNFIRMENNNDKEKFDKENFDKEKFDDPNLMLKNLNVFRNKSIHILSSIIKYTTQKNIKSVTSVYENDSNVIRITQCLNILLKIKVGIKNIDNETKEFIETFINGDKYYHDFIKKEEDKYCSLYGSSSKNCRKIETIEANDINNEEDDNISLISDKEMENVDNVINFRILKEKKNVLNIFDDEIVTKNENFEQMKLKYSLKNDILYDYNEFKYPIINQYNYSSTFLSKLHKSQAITSIDDDIFIEIFPIISTINLILEFYIYNQSGIDLQNIFINLSTHNNLKPIDKIPQFNLAPYEKKKFKTTIKVHTTETGTIFGYVFFEKKNDPQKYYIVLNEININMNEYITASFVSSHLFRIMWSEFEWENKINVNTSISDAFELLKLIIKHTNMTIVERFMPLEYYEHEMKNIGENENITPIDIYISYISTLDDLKLLVNNSAFFSVNLFSRSIFGEDSLANFSVQKNPDGKLTGSIRVRSRTQGIALSLGDKITLIQSGINTELQ
ncbi:coatamer protein, beta subunit, putative [Plasmodium berghei]|uniref:Coatamer protein, beta subunit, putative n=1 Tax=Plasmodium berghei TaxID=5821 RepID=A0A0Y9X440_PLABE|nr:coatamer protein, beta subunit, putative [Plasmodium berghei]SCM17819.1 coatamer protein, beta subunit, putative [Plasmodium berghei]